MNLVHLYPILRCSLKISSFPPSSQSLKTFRISASSRTIGARAREIPARDREIDFGKYKGKMLGTLPSKYLKWVSKNLRAQDFEEWAILADQVLSDPIYRDRIEWEFAHNLLSGDVASTLGKNSAVSELLEISTRFGWDNDDKEGWKNINFELLGTSKGGRLPRLGNRKDTAATDGVVEKKSSEEGTENDSSKERRRERRMRLMRKMNDSGEKNVSGENLLNSDYNAAADTEMKKDHFVSETRSRFPGREGLLKKVLSRGSRKQF